MSVFLYTNLKLPVTEKKNRNSSLLYFKLVWNVIGINSF